VRRHRCDGYVWRYLRSDLGSRFGLHPHYRGHGRTAAPRDPARVTIEDLADDIACVLDDALVDRAVLIGHSMGVQVALETIGATRTASPGSSSCAARLHPLRTFKDRRRSRHVADDPEVDPARPWVLNRLTRTLLPTRLAYEVASRLEIRRELVEPQDFMRTSRHGADRCPAVHRDAVLRGRTPRTSCAEITVPTLVVAGGRDGFTPPERSRAMADAIPGAELLEIPNASHTRRSSGRTSSTGRSATSSRGASTSSILS